MRIWHGVPEGLPELPWPDDFGHDSFIDMAYESGVRIVYRFRDLGGSAPPVSVLAFVVHGVMHYMSSSDAPSKIISDLEDLGFGEEQVQDSVVGERPTGPGFHIPGITWVANADDHYQLTLAESRYKALPQDLQSVVDALVIHPDFDIEGPSSGTGALEENAAYLSPDQKIRVISTARDILRLSTNMLALEELANEIAERVANSAGYSPLMDSGAERAFIADLEKINDRRLLARVSRRLRYLDHDSGAFGMALKERSRQAAEIWADLDELTKDQVGFASRLKAREAILAPHLTQFPESIWSGLISDIAEKERPLERSTREARYATASRILQAAGKNKSATARLLGISTAQIDRVQSCQRSDIKLSSTDPIVAYLCAESGIDLDN